MRAGRPRTARYTIAGRVAHSALGAGPLRVSRSCTARYTITVRVTEFAFGTRSLGAVRSRTAGDADGPGVADLPAGTRSLGVIGRDTARANLAATLAGSAGPPVGALISAEEPAFRRSAELPGAAGVWIRTCTVTDRPLSRSLPLVSLGIRLVRCRDQRHPNKDGGTSRETPEGRRPGQWRCCESSDKPIELSSVQYVSILPGSCRPGGRRPWLPCSL